MKKSKRYNSNKLSWSLVDWESMEEMVKVLEFGAAKYAPDNWKIGLNREETLDSLQRHLNQLYAKKELDKESQLHHVGHIMCNAMFYLYHHRNGSFLPERTKKFQLTKEQQQVLNQMLKGKSVQPKKEHKKSKTKK